MTRTPVDSTTVAAYAYDAAARVLEVEFHGGAVYRYHDVPPDVVGAWLRAPSLGAFFNERIRDAFEFEKA